MRNRSAAILLLALVLPAVSCSRKAKEKFPLVQKYSTQAGDVFYFRPHDEQFVLVERRNAIAVAIAAVPNIEAFAFQDRITVSRPAPQMEALENKTFLEKVSAQQALAITADGRVLAGGDANGVVSQWNLADGNLRIQLDKKGAIQSLAFSPDGNFLAVGVAKPINEPADTLWIHDVQGRGPHRNFGHDSVQALAWSRDSHWYAAGLDDGSVLLGEADSDKEPRRLAVSASPVTSLSFHPSGLFLASAHADKRIVISKASTGEQVFTFEPPLPPNPLFPRIIEQVAFDETGARMAVAYADGDMRIWDTSALSQSKQATTACTTCAQRIITFLQPASRSMRKLRWKPIVGAVRAHR